ncbi:MAG: response regulator [Acidobacteriota bacterium]
MRILLVDDNQADVFLVKDAIRQEGFAADIHTAEDGERAIHLIRAVDGDPDTPCFDCFVIDLNLPRQSGAAVLDIIRSSRRCVDAPVIIITSAVAPAERERALKAGATHVLLKPFRLAEFRDLAKLVGHPKILAPEVFLLASPHRCLRSTADSSEGTTHLHKSRMRKVGILPE